MGQALSEVAGLHARLQQQAAALFCRLDEEGTLVHVPFERFVDAVDVHVRTDLTIGYSVFLRHSNESVRRIAERALADREVFPQEFESFSRRWRNASEERLRSLEFREELETLVSHLLKRIRIERRLLSMLSHVA